MGNARPRHTTQSLRQNPSQRTPRNPSANIRQTAREVARMQVKAGNKRGSAVPISGKQKLQADLTTQRNCSDSGGPRTTTGLHRKNTPRAGQNIRVPASSKELQWGPISLGAHACRLPPEQGGRLPTIDVGHWPQGHHKRKCRAKLQGASAMCGAAVGGAECSESTHFGPRKPGGMHEKQ